jgi:hypothetical protein
MNIQTKFVLGPPDGQPACPQSSCLFYSWPIQAPNIMVNFSTIGIVHTLLITTMMHDTLRSKNLQHAGLQILTLGKLLTNSNLSHVASQILCSTKHS